MADPSLPWVSRPVAQQILNNLQIAYPIVLLFLYIGLYTVRSIVTAEPEEKVTPQKPEQLGPGGKPLPKKNPIQKKPELRPELDFSKNRKLLFGWVSVGVLASLGANTILVIVHAIVERQDQWWCGQAPTIYLVGSFMVYTLLLIHMIDSRPSPNVAHLGSWLVAVLMELILLGASLAVYTTEHRQPKVGQPDGGELDDGMTSWEVAEVTMDIIRLLFLGALVGFYALFILVLGKNKKQIVADTEERTPLLSDQSQQSGYSAMENGALHTANGQVASRAGHGHDTGAHPHISHANGAARAGGHDHHDAHGHTHGAANGKGHAHGHAHGRTAGPAGWEKPTESTDRNWWEYLRAYAVFLPYIWPYKDRRLQVSFVVCFALVFVQRGIQLLVPLQAGRITDILSGTDGPIYMPWGAISLYVVYRIFQGSNGILGAARQVLWIPIDQYSYRELSVAAFEHVHSLSLEFHLGKKTGEVISAMGKGGSLNTFLENVTFQVIPMLVDLIVAIFYFIIKFDAYYALVIAVVTFWYIYITIRMASWRVDLRRAAVNASREEDAVKNDSMMSYETVKYFNAERYEFNRYRKAVEKFQKAEYRVTFTLALLNTVQNLIFMLGLIVACFVAAYQVTVGILSVGAFVILLTYMIQLQQPLNFFGTFYRVIQSNMINSERMLELFKEKPTVVDNPDAVPLPSCEGAIRYDNVRFAYDSRKPALNSLDFTCEPGTTTALVGESGGGKSTVFRLLFRFYNIQSGTIQVDGHDVEGLTIDSLRQHIGVVPQDTVLFNETLMYNLKYACQGVTDEDVYEACRAASIHDRIMGFPDRYETKVGERGLRLSGGEKQRVAIARTILKNPRIILLDEATAALDTETEEHIQEALKTLAKGRTMLIIAHRLSTITMCDQILVLHEGKVAEKGTHSELISKKGRYAGMWRKQVRAQKAAEEAKVLTDKAERLRRESLDSREARYRSMGGSKAGDDSPLSSDEEEAQKQLQLRQKEFSMSPKPMPGSVAMATALKPVVEEDLPGKPPGHP